MTTTTRTCERCDAVEALIRKALGLTGPAATTVVAPAFTGDAGDLETLVQSFVGLRRGYEQDLPTDDPDTVEHEHKRGIVVGLQMAIDLGKKTGIRVDDPAPPKTRKSREARKAVSGEGGDLLDGYGPHTRKARISTPPSPYALSLLWVAARRHPSPSTDEQIAVLSGRSRRSSSFTEAMGALREGRARRGAGERARRDPQRPKAGRRAPRIIAERRGAAGSVAEQARTVRGEDPWRDRRPHTRSPGLNDAGPRLRRIKGERLLGDEQQLHGRTRQAAQARTRPRKQQPMHRGADPMTEHNDGPNEDDDDEIDENEVLEDLMERMEERICEMVDRVMIEVTDQTMKEDSEISAVQSLVPSKTRLVYEGAVTMVFLQRLSAFYAANMAKAGECEAHTIAEIVPIVCEGVAEGFYANAEMRKRERGETRQ